jgi:hypothetical protein
MTKLREWLPANRVVALIGMFTAIGVVIASFQTSLVAGSPAAEAVAKAAGVVAGIITMLGIVLKFLEGSQNIDSLTIAGVPKVPGATVVQSTTATDMDTGAVLEADILAHDNDGDGDPATGHPDVPEFTDEDRARGFGVGSHSSVSASPPLLEGETEADIGKDSGDPPLRPVD